jgi:WD40 repeat protein
MLITGTHDGVYQVSGIERGSEFEHEKVLDTETVMRVRELDGLDGVFAVTKSGLYHSLDGNEWIDLGIPQEEVYSAVSNPSGNRLYAGTHPAHIYVCTTPSADSSRTPNEYEWSEADGFQDLPSRDEWYTPRHRNEAHVRSLRTHHDKPQRVIAGVEAGGVHISDDNVETWEERTAEVPDDIHHLLIRGADEFIASTGFGLHRTTDGGQSWTRLDDDLEQRYFREATDHDGVVYTSAAMGPSPDWDDSTDAVLLASLDGRSLEEIESPRPNEIVLAWTAIGDTLVSGTNDGTVLLRRDDEWTVAGELPVTGQGIRSLCPHPERQRR